MFDCRTSQAARLAIVAFIHAGTAAAASSDLKVSDVPLIFVEGDAVTGGVRIREANSTRDTVSVKSSSDLVLKQNSMFKNTDTTSTSYKNIITETASKGFKISPSLSLGSEASVGTASAGVDNTDSSSTTLETSNVDLREAENRREATNQVSSFNETFSTSTVSNDPNDGYLTTGIIVRNYTNDTAQIEAIFDEVVKFDLGTNSMLPQPYQQHSPLAVLRTAINEVPVAGTAVGTEVIDVIINAFPKSPSGPGFTYKLLIQPNLFASEIKDLFRSNVALVERVTDYSVKWKGRTIRKYALDEEIRIARATMVELRVYDDAAIDRMNLLEFQTPGANVTVLDVLQASGFVVEVKPGPTGDIIVSVNGKKNDLPEELSSDIYSENLSRGVWHVFRRTEAGLEKIGLTDKRVAPGDSYVVSFVTLTEMLSTQRRTVRDAFRVVNLAFTDISIYDKARTLPLWVPIASADSTFPELSPAVSYCEPDDNRFIRVGDEIKIRFKSALGTLINNSRIISPEEFQQMFGAGPAWTKNVIAYKKPTVWLPIANDWSIIGPQSSPDKYGLQISFGLDSPKASLSSLLSKGAGRFTALGDGVVDLSFQVSRAMLGVSNQPLCLHTQLSKTKGIKWGPHFEEPELHPRPGRTAIPLPDALLRTFDRFVKSGIYLVTEADTPQSWAIQISVRSLPWRP